MEYAFCQYNYTSPLYFVVFLCTKNSQNYKILILFEIIFYFCLSLDTLRRPGSCRHSQGNPPHPPHPRGRPVTEIMDTVGSLLRLPPGSRQTPRVVTFHFLMPPLGDQGEAFLYAPLYLLILHSQKAALRSRTILRSLQSGMSMVRNW